MQKNPKLPPKASPSITRLTHFSYSAGVGDCARGTSTGRVLTRCLGLDWEHFPAKLPHPPRRCPRLRLHPPKAKRYSSSSSALVMLCAAWGCAAGRATIPAGARRHGANGVLCVGYAGRLAEAAGGRVACCSVTRRGKCVGTARRVVSLPFPGLDSTARLGWRPVPCSIPNLCRCRCWRWHFPALGSKATLGGGTGRTDGEVRSSCSAKDVTKLSSALLCLPLQVQR